MLLHILYIFYLEVYTRIKSYVLIKSSLFIKDLNI